MSTTGLSPWLGEVVGTSLALGKAMGQPLLALSKSYGAPSVLRRCSVSTPSQQSVAVLVYL